MLRPSPRSLVVLAFALLALNACSGAAGSTPAYAANELRIGDREPVRGFLPPYNGGWVLERLMQSCLLVAGPNDELEPSLAVTVPTQANGMISKDGTQIDYHLRHDAVWEDGRRVDAGDVIFTWHAILNPKNDYEFRTPYSQVSAITTLDPFTIRVKLRQPNAAFVPKFFAENWCLDVLPSHVYAKYASFDTLPAGMKPVASGAFLLDAWEHDNRAIFHANPHYFGGAPHIGRIVDMFVPNAETLVTGMKTGELNADFDASPKEAVALANRPDLHIEVSRQPVVGTLFFNCTDPITANSKLRQGIAYALDRTAMARDVSYGYFDAREPEKQPYDFAYDPAVPRPEYDPARADALLDASGWPRGPGGMRMRAGRPLELVMISSVTGIDPQVDVLVQSQLARAGISVIVKTFDNSALYAPASENGPLYGRKFQIWYNTYNFQGDDGDLAEELDCDQHMPIGLNVFDLCDPRLDAANRAALRTYDVATRKKYYARAQRYLYEDMPWVLLWTEPKIDIYTKRLTNFAGTPGPPSFYRPNTWRLQ